MNPLSNDVRTECLFLARKTLHAHVRRQQAGDARDRGHTGGSAGQEFGSSLAQAHGGILVVMPVWGHDTYRTTTPDTTNPLTPATSLRPQ